MREAMTTGFVQFAEEKAKWGMGQNLIILKSQKEYRENGTILSNLHSEMNTSNKQKLKQKGFWLDLKKIFACTSDTTVEKVLKESAENFQRLSLLLLSQFKHHHFWTGQMEVMRLEVMHHQHPRN